MATKLYYTVQKETQQDDSFEYCTGTKNIAVYEIVKDRPKLFFDVDVDNEDRCDESIDNWLEDNGFGNRLYDFVEL